MAARSDFVIILCATAIGAGAMRLAAAEPFDDAHIEAVEPTGMNDRATLPPTISWCEPRYSDEMWENGRIHRAIGSHCCEMWIDAAIHLCQHPEDPTWRKQ